jgi:hypothetical protein
MIRPPRTDYRTQTSRDAEARVLAMCGQGVVLGLG